MHCVQWDALAPKKMHQGVGIRPNASGCIGVHPHGWLRFWDRQNAQERGDPEQCIRMDPADRISCGVDPILTPGSFPGLDALHAMGCIGTQKKCTIAWGSTPMHPDALAWIPTTGCVFGPAKTHRNVGILGNAFG